MVWLLTAYSGGVFIVYCFLLFVVFYLLFVPAFWQTWSCFSCLVQDCFLFLLLILPVFISSASLLEINFLPDCMADLL